VLGLVGLVVGALLRVKDTGIGIGTGTGIAIGTGIGTGTISGAIVGAGTVTVVTLYVRTCSELVTVLFKENAIAPTTYLPRHCSVTVVIVLYLFILSQS
jgi:hypothetical protein